METSQGCIISLKIIPPLFENNFFPTSFFLYNNIKFGKINGFY